MSFFRKLFKGESKVEQPKPEQSAAKEPEQDEPQIVWLPAKENPWGIPVLDLRPIALHMTSTSKNEQMAMNAVSYNSEDGRSFVGQPTADQEVISAAIKLPIDKVLLPGVLFVPNTMEHKWAIYFHNDEIIFIRSWLRQVFVIAKTRQTDNELIIESIKGRFTADETPEFTRAVAKFLLISHVTETVVPAPLAEQYKDSPLEAAYWAFSAYGNMAQVGTFDINYSPVTTAPLRSHSLLHIAVARADKEQIKAHLQSGIDINAFAGDGQTPMHWAVSVPDVSAMELLIESGASPDVRNTQGATPLMNATQRNQPDKVVFLIKAGADVNAQDDRGFTSLHRAAEMGHEELVKILLENGADKMIAAAGHTAMSLAEARERTAIIQMLA
jgi:hypothetical protein